MQLWLKVVVRVWECVGVGMNVSVGVVWVLCVCVCVCMGVDVCVCVGVHVGDDGGVLVGMLVLVCVLIV